MQLKLMEIGNTWTKFWDISMSCVCTKSRHPVFCLFVFVFLLYLPKSRQTGHLLM